MISVPVCHKICLNTENVFLRTQRTRAHRDTWRHSRSFKHISDSWWPLHSVRSQTIRGRSPSSSLLLGLNPQTRVHAVKRRLSEPAAFTFSADWAILAHDLRIREAGKNEIRRRVNVKIKIWHKKHPKHQKSNKCPVRVSLFVCFLSCCMCLCVFVYLFVFIY